MVCCCCCCCLLLSRIHTGFDLISLNLFPQTPWNPRVEMPIEAASVHFLIGMCHSELGRPLGALDAFNNAIRVNPDFAEVF